MTATMRKAVGIPVHPNGRRIALAFAALTFVLAPTAEAAFSDVGVSVGLDTGGPKDGGVAWADFNLDGALDVLVSRTDGTGTRLYFSFGGAEPTFEDVTDTRASGLTRRTLGRAAVAADFNNDGLPDFARGGPARIEVYLNQGSDSDPAFRFGSSGGAPNFVADIALIEGLTGGLGTLDWNGDGNLDLVVDRSEGGMVLLSGSGGGDFATVPGEATGLSLEGTSGGFATLADVDGDGPVDVVMRQQEGPDFLRARAPGSSLRSQSGPNFNAPGGAGTVAACDIDNDGDLDLLFSGPADPEGGYTGSQNRWQIASAGGFSDSEAMPLLGLTEVADAQCGDLDNDGDLDLFLVAGGSNLMLINQFMETGSASWIADNQGVTAGGVGSAAAFVDYDSDGDLDLLLHQDDGNALWRSDVDDNNYLALRLTRSNEDRSERDDIGASAQLFNLEGEPRGPRLGVSGGHGHGSQGSPVLHFGLPDGPEETYRIEISFRSTDADGVMRASVLVTPDELGDYQLLEVSSSDPDRDGLDAAEEAEFGTDPLLADTDGDGLSDRDEVLGAGPLVGFGPSDPLDADVDDDGLLDGSEIRGTGLLEGYAPTDPRETDSDDDGLADGLEVGAPGVSNGRTESGISFFGSSGYSADLDPESTTDPNLRDTDGDGLSDGLEDGNSNGRADYILGDTSTVGSGETDPRLSDTDDDGVSDGDELARGMNATDTDSDNGGTLDGLEVERGWDPLDPADDDTDEDGIGDLEERRIGTDPFLADTDGDGIGDRDERDGTGPLSPYGPTSPTDQDSDDDGVADGDEANGTGPNDGVVTNPLARDTDFDLLHDGLELGVTEPLPNFTTEPSEIPVFGTRTDGLQLDFDPSTTTDPTLSDTDRDGINDGTEDADQNGYAEFSLGGTGSGGVGETDATDQDTDDDGLTDGMETFVERTDPLDSDSDDGGIIDGIEAEFGFDPLDPSDDSTIVDTDSDGLPDVVETALGSDVTDPDTDGDGVADAAEIAGGVPYRRETGSDLDPLDADTDDDGISDGAEPLGAPPLAGPRFATDPLDPDTDGDGLSDGLEAGVTVGVPAGSSDGGVEFAGSNGFEVDADPDTTTDPVAVDTDEDGLADGVEDANQDGAWTATIGGTGSQGDGETDPRNPDTDEDGITDGAEIEETMTDPLDSDTDDGTISDGEELAAGTDPNDPADDLEGVDTDEDGLNDSLEAVLGTDPEDADTDNDGVTDGAEIAAGDAEAYDPGVDSDPRDADTDDDGLADNTEIAGAGPLQRFAPTDPAQRDTDEDGISDGVEVGVFRPVIGGTSDGPAAIRYSGTDEEAFAADDDVETTTDPSVADTDSDGLLDGEEDLDANGAVSEEETDPNNADTDGGGAPDGVEVERGSDPLDPFDDRVVGEDRDGDALSDDEEADLGTDPDNADTDGDGLGDGREVFAVNPTDPLSADSDGDGLCDGALDAATCVAGEDLNGNARVDAGETDPNNPDTDSGGRSDGDEVRFDGTDPLDPDDDIQPPDPEVRFRGAGLTACASSGSAGSSGWLILICAWLVRRASSDRRR